MHLVVLQDLQESEGCQDELALRVQQLKAELVLFKGLMSNVSAARHPPHVVALSSYTLSHWPSLARSCPFCPPARVAFLLRLPECNYIVIDI